MWRNYLTVGLRALAKNKTYAVVNILGLAIGLAACLLLLLYVRYEMSYDRWLPNSDRIYQLQTHYTDPTNGQPFNLQMTAYVSGVALKKDFPEVEQIAYVLGGSLVAMRNGQAVTIENGVRTDGNFFDVIPLPMVKGDPKTALSSVNDVVLSRSEATRLFGSEDPVGKMLTLVQQGKQVDHRVTGIFEDLPKNSHMRFNMIARMNPTAYFAETPEFLTSWGWQSGWVYARLRPGADAKAMEARFPAWEKRNIPDDRIGDQVTNQGDSAEFKLVNAGDVHLGVGQAASMTPGNDRGSILTFAVIAVLILAMACVNFTNLATARASLRAREVALRKVLGARRRQLVAQFLGESVLLAAIAMLLALALVELSLPALSNFLDADLAFRFFGTDGVILPVLALILVVGAAGGLYPAFYLSRFKPAEVLKANKSTAEAKGSGRFRGVLVVGQFAVSIGLIICTAVVYLQTVHARTGDPGFERNGLIQISRLGARQLRPSLEALVQEVERVPGVVSVGRSQIGVDTQNSMNTAVQGLRSTEPVSIGIYAVDTNFFRTAGIRTVAGRIFDAARPMDDATLPIPETPEAVEALHKRGLNVVLNEYAARRIGFANPADAVGKQIRASVLDAERLGLAPLNVIGVVQDSRFRSIRDPIDSIIFRYDRQLPDNMLVRYNGNPEAVREGIERAWRKFATDVPFEAEFSEAIIGRLYSAEDARAMSFAGFALLAVIVACLGLFGLAAFTAERRTKEIGVRKVLGARTRDIVRLLVWQFSKPVVIANIIAWPVAWWLMREWLNGFDDRITLGPAPFVVAGALALLIAVATIGAHAFRVARQNPINALRYE